MDWFIDTLFYALPYLVFGFAYTAWMNGLGLTMSNDPFAFFAGIVSLATLTLKFLVVKD